MKKKFVFILMIILLVPVMPIFAESNSTVTDDSIDVNIGIGGNTVNLNVTCTTSEGGTMHIFVNGTEITKTYQVYNTYTHNYDSEIFVLNQKFEVTKYNVIALANYTTGMVTVIGSDINAMNSWIGVYRSNTSLLSKEIIAGNTTIILELEKLDLTDFQLLRLLEQTTLNLNVKIADLNVEIIDLNNKIDVINVNNTKTVAEFKEAIKQKTAEISVEQQRTTKLEIDLQNLTYALGCIIIILIIVIGVVKPRKPKIANN
jgi:hypothetical protein